MKESLRDFPVNNGHGLQCMDLAPSFQLFGQLICFLLGFHLWSFLDSTYGAPPLELSSNGKACRERSVHLQPPSHSLVEYRLGQSPTP